MSAMAQTSSLENIVIVYMDLETTSLDTKKAEIIEIAAIVDTHSKQSMDAMWPKSMPKPVSEFSSFVCPVSKCIPECASKVNGIQYADVEYEDGFASTGRRFFDWLSLMKRHGTTAGSQIVLVAHNNHAYDGPVLRQQCKAHKVNIPTFVVMLDSLPAFKQCFPFPGRKFSLQCLADLWLKKSKVEQDHRALSDVRLLIAVIENCPDPTEFMSCLVEQQRKT